MFETLINAWKIEDIRKKMLYTLLILAIVRIGAGIPVPFLDHTALAAMISSNGGIFSYLDLMSGGSFSNSTLFALSISPYITSSIVIELLTVAIPALERLAKDGEVVDRHAGAGGMDVVLQGDDPATAVPRGGHLLR